VTASEALGLKPHDAWRQVRHGGSIGVNRGPQGGAQGPRPKNKGPVWGLFIQKSKILLHSLLLTGTQSCITMGPDLGSYGPYGPIVTPLNIISRKQNLLIFTSIEK